MIFSPLLLNFYFLLDLRNLCTQNGNMTAYHFPDQTGFLQRKGSGCVQFK